MAFSADQWRPVKRVREWQSASISNRIMFSALALTMIVALFIGVISYVAIRVLIERSITSGLESQAGLIEQKLSTDLNNISKDLDNLSRNSFIANGLVDSLGRDTYLLPFLREHRMPVSVKTVIILCDFKGTPIASNLTPLPLLPQGIRLVKESLEKGESHTETAQAADGLYLLLAMPVIFPPTGHAEGAIMVMISLKEILASNTMHLGKEYTSDLMVEGVSISGGLAIPAGYETIQIEKQVKFGPSHDPLTLRLFLGQKKSEAFALLRWVALIFILIGASTLALVFYLARAIALRLTAPLASLSRTAGMIAESGSLHVIAEAGGHDEVGTLVTVFNEMLDTLRSSHEHLEWLVEERTRELKEAGQRLRNLIDGLGPYIFVGLLTTDGRLVEANQPTLTAANIKLEDVLNKPFEETYWWSYSEQVKSRLRSAIERAAQGESSRYDEQVRVGENQFIIVDFSIQPMLDDSGKVIFLIPSGIVITERKRAEEELRRYHDQLEDLVKERTQELEKKVGEIERLNTIFVGREMRMIELKERIKELEKEVANRKMQVAGNEK